MANIKLNIPCDDAFNLPRPVEGGYLMLNVGVFARSNFIHKQEIFITSDTVTPGLGYTVKHKTTPNGPVPGSSADKEEPCPKIEISPFVKTGDEDKWHFAIKSPALTQEDVHVSIYTTWNYFPKQDPVVTEDE